MTRTAVLVDRSRCGAAGDRGRNGINDDVARAYCAGVTCGIGLGGDQGFCAFAHGGNVIRGQCITPGRTGDGRGADAANVQCDRGPGFVGAGNDCAHFCCVDGVIAGNDVKVWCCRCNKQLNFRRGVCSGPVNTVHPGVDLSQVGRGDAGHARCRIVGYAGGRIGIGLGVTGNFGHSGHGVVGCAAGERAAHGR